MKSRKKTPKQHPTRRSRYLGLYDTSLFKDAHPLLAVFIGFFVLIVGSALYLTVQLRPANELHEVKHLPSEFNKITKLTPSPASFRIPILLYHYVEYVQDKKDTMRVALNINPNVFDAQMKTLKDAGFTFMTASELGDVLDGKRTLPTKPILITIDDGHWDLYTDILPILEKYHVRATAYIISGFLGGSDFLSPDQLQKVIDSGLIEIGDHTVDHIALAGKLLPIVQYEVTQSKKTLEQTYHLHIVSFAYPSGSFDKQAADVVKNAGFTNAVSTIPGIDQNVDNRFFLYRIRPGYRTGQDLLDYLNQTSYKPW